MSGYTDKEKVVIARKYLIPKQYKVHGINSLGNVSTEITDNFISNVICHYTREAGVRGVERQIAQICRYIVLEVINYKLLYCIIFNNKKKMYTTLYMGKQ